MRLSPAILVASILSTSMLFGQTISPAPTEGDQTVTVLTAPFLAGDAIALYSFLPLNPPAPPPAPPAVCSAVPANLIALTAGTTTVVLGGAQTTLTLASPLVANTQLCAVITPVAGGAAGTGKAVTVQPPPTPPGFDWGRVRAYFTVGDLASQERNQFSHQDLFLSFHLDKTYRMLRNLDATGPRFYSPGLNTFFETRLTAIPVAVQTCAASSSTPCSSSSTPTAGTPVDTTVAYLNTQKTARLQFGLYAPFLLSRWSVPTKKAGAPVVDTPYALFLAPLVKTGFDTTLNGLNQTQQQAGTPTQVQVVGSSSQFYKFYDFGFRLGHYKLSGDRNTAPDLLSYLDVGWGRFSNLASLLCPSSAYTGNNTCSSPAGSLAWQRDFRMNVEGLLEIPATHGFSIGFSSNVSFYKQGKPAANTGFVHIKPADDLRFLFAYKFDIAKIAAKLSPGFSQ